MSNPPSGLSTAEIYRVVAARRNSRDTLVWQTASIALAAQSFLYTIAIGAQSRPASRLIALGLSLVASLATMRLMAKHRTLEVADSKFLEDFETEKPSRYSKEEKNAPHAKPTTIIGCFPFEAYCVWQYFQGLFAATSLVLFITVAAAGDGWFTRESKSEPAKGVITDLPAVVATNANVTVYQPAQVLSGQVLHTNH